MSRPKIEKNICFVPDYLQFAPVGKASNEVVTMTYEEYTTIMLIDYQKLQQEDCATRMDVSRTTVQFIYTSARAKLADVLVNGKTLQLEGGNYKICEDKNKQCLTGHCSKCCKNGQD